MTNNKSSNKLNRFTTLPYLLELLKTSKLSILSPNTWEDHNDRDILMDYKEKMGRTSILALCFTDQRETIHHWKAFSNGESGCCIEFDKQKLIDEISKDENIQHKNVNYRLIKASQTIDTKDIPFSKRIQYECENEYRLVMLTDEDILYYQIVIPLNFITKITLSPSLPKLTFNVIKEVIEKLIDGLNITINHSSLFENEDWISGFKKRP